MDVFCSPLMLNVAALHPSRLWCHRHVPAAAISEKLQPKEARLMEGKSQMSESYILSWACGDTFAEKEMFSMSRLLFVERISPPTYRGDMDVLSGGEWQDLARWLDVVLTSGVHDSYPSSHWCTDEYEEVWREGTNVVENLMYPQMSYKENWEESSLER